jgi:hypothetical protein
VVICASPSVPHKLARFAGYVNQKTHHQPK